MHPHGGAKASVPTMRLQVSVAAHTWDPLPVSAPLGSKTCVFPSRHGSSVAWETEDILHVSMPSSSSSVAAGRSYDLSMAARKLSLQPRPLMMRGRGLWKGRSPFKVTSATAVWRLSRELDFFRPSEGPTSLVEEPGGAQTGGEGSKGPAGDCVAPLANI